MENGPRAEHAGRGAWHDALEKIGAWEPGGSQRQRQPGVNEMSRRAVDRETHTSSSGRSGTGLGENGPESLS